MISVLADGSVKWASTDADLLFGIKGAGLSMGGTQALFSPVNYSHHLDLK